MQVKLHPSIQVETVAQFGVIFLLFALGLEFSSTKVGLCAYLLLVTCNFIYFLVDLILNFLQIYFFMFTDSNCSSSGYSWWSAPNFLTYVLVWDNSLGM